MTESTPSGHRRWLRTAILTTVALLGGGQVFYYYIWSGRLSASFHRETNDRTVHHPQQPVESDRACILLDRPFLAANLPDYTKTSLKQWTQCQRLNNTLPEWTVHHCVTPGSNNQADDDPSCYPGGYFRIQRTQFPAATAAAVARVDHTSLLEKGTCRLNSTATLAEDSITNQYASSFLGPDTFRVVLVGPERLSLMQQQSLGNCTYAIPYLISRPGRFWVQKIFHTYENYNALNENRPRDWWPEYHGKDLLASSSAAPSPQQQQQEDQDQQTHHREYFHFDVCSHCVPWVAIDEAQGLAGTKKACTTNAKMQSRQYGTYRARMPIESVQQAVSHPYEWIPVRPRCMFYPAVTSFEPRDASDSDEIKAQKKEASNCLLKPRSIAFVGDEHLQTLFTGVMQRLRGDPGPIEVIEKSREAQVLRVNQVQARLDFDADLSETLARIQSSLDPQGVLPDDEDATDPEDPVPDLANFDDIDTVVLGLGVYPASVGHWTTVQFQERVKAVLEGLASIRNERQVASGGDKMDRRNNLKVIWMGTPAWTDRTDQETRNAADWRTNHRILYWNKLVEEMIERINVQAGGDGIIDKLSGLPITISFKSSTQELYTAQTPVDSLAAELIHKLDLCS
ncbi:hypothetical protein BGZ70_000715 [Mortierella alpina]|uniref:Uncharacterized protein n=1 Tax=Mortierella alpina TaxID=64518 RepID=A0A9P6IXR7_MORAP|nr:hypothetical protein BGZ70_000715 [Mortierella alpina]